MTTHSKVWFVTGTSSGFGRAIVEHVVARGDRVVATARNPDDLRDLIAIAPDRILATRLDVTRAVDVEPAIAAALDRFGAIDVLVNNAGYSVIGALEETPEAELRSALETMFFGAVATSRAVLPHMRGRGGGAIVQITSVGGVVTAPGFGPYCAAKHALEAVSEALAGEVSPHGIRVLIVEPGAFRTRLFGGAFRAMPALEAYRASVGPTRDYVRQQTDTQAGDPAKAARAIYDAVAAGCPTLRLPLGDDAVAGIRKKLAAIAADVDQTEAVAAATAFDR